MNKKLFTLLSGVAIITSASLQSCADEFDPAIVTKQDQMGIDYTENFISRFGTPDPNQKWGMDEVLQPIGGLAKAKTRAAGDPGTVWTNRNQWVERDGSGSPYSSLPYKTDAFAHDIQIPGWPHLNGLYYGNNGESSLKNTWTAASLPNGAQPCGDVTEYEIQYVSAFFRTHTKAQMADYEVTLHLSDFFIQNVSGDNDQLTYDAITSTDKTGYNGENITRGDQNTSYIWRKTGSQEAINYKLEQLGFKSMEGTDNWTHVNNFNSQNTNFNPEESSNNGYREIKYVTSSGTEDFRCYVSFSSEWIDNWVLVKLTWNEKVKNPDSPELDKVIPREGYYLAFDFESHAKEDTKVSADGYYSNWIVKITPGHFAPEGKARRVMCEDLGGTYDFDFNDAVFDAAIDKDEIIVTVQAAGGTMPIYIGKSGSDYEIHNLLGGDSSTPINVDSKTHAPAIYRVPKGEITKIGQIQVTVNNPSAGNISITGGESERANLDDPTNNPYSNPTEKGGTVAPRAFAVPTSVKWMKELQWIDKTYTRFAEWVANKDIKFEDPNTHQQVDWYKYPLMNADKLYTVTTNLAPGSPTGQSPSPESWIQLTPVNSNLTNVGADGSLDLQIYSGTTDPIYKELDKTTDPAAQITFTVVLKSADKLNYDSQHMTLKGILIPADVVATPSEHDGNTMHYQGTYFTKDILTNDPNWHNALWQETFGTEGKDASGNYTYTLKFTFNRAQLLSGKKDAETGKDLYCDCIFLFLEGASSTTIAEWYVHY